MANVEEKKRVTRVRLTKSYDQIMYEIIEACYHLQNKCVYILAETENAEHFCEADIVPESKIPKFDDLDHTEFEKEVGGDPKRKQNRKDYYEMFFELNQGSQDPYFQYMKKHFEKNIHGF